MISRLMYKPHITCLSKDILVQNGKTLTTDTLINMTLTNGSEVYCIDTSECYLYDEENKTLIKTKVNNDILIDGEITPESVNIINTKVDNFINDVNERIAQADINKITELSGKIVELESDIDTLNSDIDNIERYINNDKTLTDMSLYVSKNGNDNNNGLTPETAFLTFQKAIDFLPQTVNHVVTINIGEGVYLEDIRISGFQGMGKISIKGASDLENSTLYSINSMTINNCVFPVQITGLSFTATEKHSLSVYYSTGCWVQSCSFVSMATSFYGVCASYGMVTIRDCTISNKSRGIVADYNSQIVSHTNTGTNNTTALMASNNSTIGKVNTQPSGTTAESAINGSIIR